MRKRKRFSGATKMLCLVMVFLLMIGAMPLHSTLASADNPTEETAEETSAQSMELVTPEPEAVPAPSEEAATSTPSIEPEASTEPSVEPEQSASSVSSPEPEESAEPESTAYVNSISGLLWYDENDDGTYDSGEQPVAAYPVYLYVAGDTSTAVQTVRTDADGRYSFEDIEPDSYIVGVKSNELGTNYYLLPVVGVTGDNKFAIDTSEWIYAYTELIEVETDSEITGMDAGMRTPPQIQPMAAYTIDLATVTALTAPPGTTYSGNGMTGYLLTFNSTAIGNTYTINTSVSTTNRIVVDTGSTTALGITLGGVTISTGQSPMQLLGSSNVNLTLVGSNVLTSTFATTSAPTGYAGLYVASTATLTINGTGSLNATGGLYGAGIGGGIYNVTYSVSNVNTGKIVINGGTVTATGGVSAAGIGGGCGNVNATNGTYGGNGTIEINGGTVTATGGGNGAGIGGGGPGYSPNRGATGGTITITGGTVTATGGGGAAGIGGGIAADGGVITISGGTVTATGGQYGAGIGGGGGPMSGPTAGGAGTVTITGGRITATGGIRLGTANRYAPGIGAGWNYMTNTVATTGTVIFTGGSILPRDNGGTVSVIPSPTNGSTNGAPDVVHMVQFPGYSDNDPFYIIAGGTKQSYDYYANAHPNGTVYPWLIYPGVLTKDATNITTATADLHGETYLEGTYSVTSGYFEVTTTSGSYTSPVATVPITPTSTSTAGVIDQYSAPVNGLSSGTTYYYRFVIKVGSVAICGNEVMFKTPCLVIEHYLKGDGSTLQSAATSNVANGGSFTGSPPATIASGGDTYTYTGYRLGSTTATLNSGTPTAITISADTNIYYYYIGPPTVTASHTVTGGTTATLNGTYNLDGGTFTSGLFEISTDGGLTWTSVPGGTLTGLTTTPSVNLTGLTPGATYDYRLTVTSNGGTSTATGSFTTGFAITEKFVDLSGSSVDTSGLPDNTVYVSGSYTATGIPTSHMAGSDTYNYIGYKLDSYTPGDTLTSGTPSGVTVTAARDVYYVYTKALPSIKIEKYDNGGTTPLANAEFKLEKLVASGGAVDPSFTAVTQTTAGAGGDTTFTGLPAGIYRITETKAPSGFATLTESFEVTIPYKITLPTGQTPTDTSYFYATTSGSNTTYHYYDVTYKVSDQAAIAMPVAGVFNTMPPYALIGGALVLVAACAGTILLIKRRRAKHQPKHAV